MMEGNYTISGVCFKADKSSRYTRYCLAKTKLQPSFQVQMLIISLSVTIMKFFFFQFSSNRWVCCIIFVCPLVCFKVIIFRNIQFLIQPNTMSTKLKLKFTHTHTFTKNTLSISYSTLYTHLLHTALGQRWTSFQATHKAAPAPMLLLKPQKYSKSTNCKQPSSMKTNLLISCSNERQGFSRTPAAIANVHDWYIILNSVYK